MSYQLMATKRAVKGPKTRLQGLVPAVVYGTGKDSLSISVNYAEFSKLYKAAGEASLIDLSLDGQNEGKVLVQDIQYNPVNDKILHVDLRRIDMTKPMKATVELRFVGEAPIIKASGGTLVASLQAVEVECLPKDLVSHLDIDLSCLTTYEDVIKVKNLVLPSGITIHSPHSEALVAKAMRALTEEEIKAMEAATEPVDLSKIEVAGKKKEEAEEATAEGAPAKAEEKSSSAKATEDKKEKK